MSLRFRFSNLLRPFPVALILFSATTVMGGDIVGRVDLTEKGGKKAPDLSDIVIYVENSKARTRPAKEVLSKEVLSASRVSSCNRPTSSVWWRM